MKITKKNLSNNKEIYFIKNKSMKTIIVWFMFYMPLDNKASENALISNILLKGSKFYPSSREMSRFLNESYGAILGTDVNLKGEVYTLGVHINYINPSLEFIERDQTKDILSFLKDVIYNPVEENGGFKEDYFKVEKQNLLIGIQGKINDKDSYAFDKTIEVMCENEAYSIDKLGKAQWVEELGNKKCYERYKDIVNNFPLKIYVMGDVNMEDFSKTITDVFDFNDSKGFEVKINHKDVNEIKEIVEKIDTNQGKLCLGFRTSIDINSGDFPSLAVVNRLFGGGPESKLFLEIREKESLCYTVYSTVEKHKGMMFVACGINPNVKEKTKEKIIDVLNDIRNGNFTNEDLSTCKAALKHSLTSIKDNKYTYIGYLQGLNIYDASYTLEDLCEKVETVSREDVIRAAKTINLDTVYFLGRCGENEN